MERRTVRVNGTELSFIEAGQGKPLVFVHGAVTTSDLFEQSVGYFSVDYHAIAMDLRGYGASAKPGLGYTIEQFSEDLAGFLQALELPPTVMVGVSMGGLVAQELALRHAHQLGGLVLASTSDGELGPALKGNPDEAIRMSGWRGFSAKAITDAFPPGTDEGIIRRLLDRIDTWDEQVIRQVFQSIHTFNSRPRLHGITVPTLVLVGSEDRQFPVPLSRRLSQQIPSARLEVFQGSGHFMMVEQPQHFRTVLSSFLNEIGY